jgi:hypothetical protein
LPLVCFKLNDEADKFESVPFYLPLSLIATYTVSGSDAGENREGLRFFHDIFGRGYL